MTWMAWFAVAAVLAALIALASNRVSADLALAGPLAVLALFGIVSPERALHGFANEGMITVGLLFVVAGSLRRVGTLALFSGRLLGARASLSRAMFRLTIPVAALSAFLNNTPVVAMLLPEVRDWARNNQLAPSRLLIPLSYASILGGTCTVIGTSTNLVVNGMLVDAGLPGFRIFEIGALGLPIAAAGIGLMLVFGRWLLPDREDVDLALADPRDFTTEVIVEPDGPLAGRRLLDVRIQNVPRLAPVEIHRQGHLIPAPRPDHVILGGDRLVVAGPSASVLALHSHHGLKTAESAAFVPKGTRELVELVISSRCPLIGRQVGDGSFRRLYNAAVIAVSRHGVAKSSLVDWRLRAGDTLLVEAGADFVATNRFRADFHMVAGHGVSQAVMPWRAWTGLAILVAMVLAATSGILSMFQAALGAAMLLLSIGFIDREGARNAVNLRVLLAICYAFGLGAALQDTGAATAAAELLTSLGGDSPWTALAMIYLTTMLCTELVTNNAAAVLMVPIALATAQGLDANPMPFAAAVMVAASASFITPLGYQTNLMVYGPGGYRFGDFLRAGLPISLVVAVMTVLLAPSVWPF